MQRCNNSHCYLLCKAQKVKLCSKKKTHLHCFGIIYILVNSAQFGWLLPRKTFGIVILWDVQECHWRKMRSTWTCFTRVVTALWWGFLTVNVASGGVGCKLVDREATSDQARSVEKSTYLSKADGALSADLGWALAAPASVTFASSEHSLAVPPDSPVLADALDWNRWPSFGGSTTQVRGPPWFRGIGGKGGILLFGQG